MTMIAYAFLQHRRSSEAGKKESTDRHLSQACRPCVTPSSTASCDRFSDARTAEKVSAQDCCIN
jgi:hypothetical protein